MAQPIMTPPGVISFGAAGVLCVGTDAEVRQGGEAILSACDRFYKWGFPCVEEYARVVGYIDERAKIIAPIVAVSPAGRATKAEVVQQLSDPGMALYAVRIMASSLARDVLALEGAP